MKAVIVQFPFGVVAFDEQSNLIEKVLFPKMPQAAARSIMKIEVGKISDETASLIALLQNAGYDTFVFENASIAGEVQRRLNVKVEVSKASEAAEILSSRMEQVAVETGFVKEAKELSLWNHNVSMEVAKLRIKGATEKRDLVIAQAIQTLDDLDRTVNLFMGRLREWYGVHFPELDRLVEKHETYARLVMNLGDRMNFVLEALEKEDIPKAKAEQTAKVAETSMGADTAEKDLAQIQALSKNVLELYELRKAMESYLDKTMDEVAPNTKVIAGSLLGARLIAIAGSLRNLAMRPASTIQVLGAEKALFRSLKTGARPPKHGLIFQHAVLHDAKKWQRGKIARAIAGKLAIAARADAFGGRYVGDVLKASLDRRIEEIRLKYPEPPPIKEQKPMREQRPGEFRDRGRGREDGDRKWRDDRRSDQKWRQNRRAGKG
ncbi:C/D box methylation guide ribonucleoprotein complex aNOP56 subunit [Candidatus Bathyarchaeota archaeon]|nr:C/D box methylation guide ribonucleoprotein complex aNOP56 subunit [Candidatus Bathyarchaeota archaeon]